MGLSDNEIRAAKWGELESLTPPQALAVRVAEALTTTPAEIDDDLYTEASQVFGEAGLVELTSAIAWKNYLARFNRMYDIPDTEYPE